MFEYKKIYATNDGKPGSQSTGPDLPPPPPEIPIVI
jgi:hypothetical protein